MNTSKAETLQALEKIQALLANEENWTTGTPARDVDDMRTEVDNKNAVKFCILGAVRKVTEENYLLAGDVRSTLHANCTYMLSTLNDTKGHAAVMALLQDSIAYLHCK